MSNKAVAVVGMCGSGKSVVSEFFVNQNWQIVYFGGVTVTQLKAQNLEINEQNERKMREGLREKYGMGAFAMFLYDEIKQKLETSNVVLDGLYSWSEYKFLKEKFGKDLIILAVVTDSKIRYQRLQSRKYRPLTNELSASRDVSEIENLEKGGPIAIADFYVTNNQSLEHLNSKLHEFLKTL